MSSKFRKIAEKFALRVVAGKYDEAYSMLSEGAQEDWSVSDIKDTYIEMAEAFEGPPPCVRLDWEDEYEESEYDGITSFYIQIESSDPDHPDAICDDPEAIIVNIDGNEQIVEIEFGRP